MEEIYKIVYGDEDEQGSLYGISIVDSPANTYEFIRLAEEDVQVTTTDEEKKLLTGVALIPDQKIRRKFKNGDEYTLFFDALTIERLSQDFLKKGYQSNATYNHLDDRWLQGATVVESWIVEDPLNDKSNAMGFKDLPKGTWMITMKLSDELWSEYIESGKARGFSVDSLLRLEKVNLKKENNNKIKKMSVLRKIIQAVMGEDIRLASIEDQTLGSLTADAFEIDNIVYQSIEEEMIALKDASFEYEGFKFTTDSEGKIISKEPLEEAVLEAVDLESEQIGEFETSDGQKVYAEWLTIGKVVTNEAKEVLADATFEVQGLFYTTDASGEIIKTEKNSDSPLWAVQLTEIADEAVAEVEAEVEVIAEEVAKPLEEIDVQALMQTIEDLKAQIETLSKEKETVLLENVELSKKPVDVRLKANAVKQSNKTASSGLEAIREIIAKNK